MPNTARKFAFGSGLGVISRLGTGAVSLLMMPFIVHRLGDRLYGIWALVAVFAGYYGLLEFGLSNAVSRYMGHALGAEQKEECNRVLNTSLLIYVGLAAAVMVAGGVVALLAPRFCKDPQDASLLSRVILIVTASVAVSFPVRAFKGVLNARLRLEKVAFSELLSLALRTTLIIAVLLRGHKVLGLAWAAFWSAIPSALLMAYFTFQELPFLRFRLKDWTRSSAKLLLSYSSYNVIVQLGNILRFQVDGLVVAGFVGLAAVTHYKIAGTLAEYFLEVMTITFGGFLYVFSRQEGAGDFQAIKRTLFFSTKLSLCTAGFIGFGLIAWGKPFIARWMGPSYWDAYAPLVILVLGWTVGLGQSPSISLLYGTATHKFLAVYNSFEGVANLLLSLLLVRKYGLVGVALGTMIPMVITKLAVQPLYVCRVAKLNRGEYFRMIGRTSAVIAGSLVIPAVLSVKLAVPDYKILALTGALSLVLYALPIWRYVFSPSETELLQKAIWPRPALRQSAD